MRIKDLTDKQKETIEWIKQRWLKFGYGLGQADHDIRFLLKVITGEDPDTPVKENKNSE